ncbi:SCO4848 family membrane protein [Microbacterium sp. NPDC077663]|uniref:SCO4848 family membrane protein n=1 Tax=Microbacterium sp. NPDC077663 TaxID=3364189 RepID=UPI0037CB2818
MLVLLITLLILNALFNLLVWPTFFRRVARDARARDPQGRPTRFLIVHAVLIGVALLLAVVSSVTAILAAVGVGV